MATLEQRILLLEKTAKGERIDVAAIEQSPDYRAAREWLRAQGDSLDAKPRDDFNEAALKWFLAIRRILHIV